MSATVVPAMAALTPLAAVDARPARLALHVWIPAVIGMVGAAAIMTPAVMVRWCAVVGPAVPSLLTMAFVVTGLVTLTVTGLIAMMIDVADARPVAVARVAAVVGAAGEREQQGEAEQFLRHGALADGFARQRSSRRLNRP